VQLNGYAIVPLEEYCALSNIPLEESILRDIEVVQNQLDCC